jgi:hypothetical protein
LFSSSVCRSPFRIFCKGGLVVMYCFTFWFIVEDFYSSINFEWQFCWVVYPRTEIVFFQCSKYLTPWVAFLLQSQF